MRLDHRARHERHAETAGGELPQGLQLVGLGDDATVRHQLEQGIAQRRPPAVGNERLAGEAPNPYALGPRERMTQGRDEYELFLEQLHALEAVEPVGIDERHHKVQAAVAELGEQREGDVLPHGDGQPRMVAAEVGDQRGRVHRPERQDPADPEHAPGESPEIVQVRRDAVHLGERAPRPREDELARFGHRDATRGATQQLDAQLTLEPANLLRDRRLCDVEVERGLGE